MTAGLPLCLSEPAAKRLVAAAQGCGVRLDYRPLRGVFRAMLLDDPDRVLSHLR